MRLALQKHRISRRVLISCVSLVVLFGFSVIVLAKLVQAVEENIWHASQSFVNGGTDVTSDTFNESCTYEEGHVGYPSTSATKKSLCVIHGQNVSFASYWIPQTTVYAVKFKNEKNYYPLNGLPAGNKRFLPKTDGLIITQNAQSRPSGSPSLMLYDNLAESLTIASRGPLGNVQAYNIDTAKQQNWLGYTTSTGGYAYMNAHSLAVSDNGRFLLAHAGYKGFVLIDTQEGTQKIINNYGGNWYSGLYNPTARAVSDDGKYVIIGNYNTVEYTGNCGDDLTAELPSTASNKTYVMKNPCDSTPLNSSLADITGLPTSSLGGVGLSFQNDNKTIEVRYSNDDTRYIGYLHVEGYVPLSLSYLALGDSYSSGEGDTEKAANGRKYYRAGTDIDGNALVPREKCHISTRSYPYLLAQGMALGEPLASSSTQWQSVACSGATAWDVKRLGTEDYLGQNNSGTPRLEGFTGAQTLKAEALNEFIPGRQKQIEFVRKYKPKVITLTMGGNDVGFGEKIEACIWSGTCSYATTRKGSLASQIEGQYENLKSLYAELYEASDHQAKIYVLGYPHFINKDQDVSCRAVGALNHDERTMIYNSLVYMNNVIEKAAAAAGVKYVDIENSLQGHRICDSGVEYVAPITNIFGKDGVERQESFHPNAYGHTTIAAEVRTRLDNKDLLEYQVCSAGRVNCPDPDATKSSIDIPLYFQGVSTMSSQYRQFVPNQIKNNDVFNISTGKGILQPSSSASVTIFSDPINLGEYIVKEDGSLQEYIAVPEGLPVGYHTLVITGQTYSGEPIELEQVILVTGSDPLDLDDNGIPDSQQPCGPFLTASGTDVDQDGIDDACDPEIGPVPAPPGPTPEPVEPTTPEPQPEEPKQSTIVTVIKGIIKVVTKFVKSLFRFF